MVKSRRVEAASIEFAVNALNLILVSLLTGALFLQTWLGGAWIIGAARRGPEWKDIPTEHVVYRDEHPRLFWLSLAIQSTVVAYLWWRVLR